MSKTENTGSMLFDDVRGPLTNLFANLSGKHSDYWLESLKKMLRKEEIPSPPIEVLEAVQSKNKSKEKIEALINFLKSIPVVYDVEIGSLHSSYFLDILVHPNVLSFSGLQEGVFHYGRFYLKDDFSFEYKKNFRLTRSKENEIFYAFLTDYEGSYKNIEGFSKALYDLGIIYQKNIPETPNI